MIKVKVANAPCSWGVLEFEERDGATYTRVLDEIAKCGYSGTELGDWGFLPTDPGKLAAELGQRQLSMLASFVPVELANQKAHQPGVEAALKSARLLVKVSEAPFIVLADAHGQHPVRTKKAGRIAREDQLTEAQWQTFTAGAELVARTVLEDTGVKTVFHHHCAGFIETPAEIERFLAGTNPLLLGLCLDTGHYTFGGGDAVEGFKKHADRIWHVHFKDCDPALAAESKEKEWDFIQSTGQGIFCELGKGSVDFPALVKELEAHNYSGWIVVEQDVLPGMGTPLESNTRNREYLRSLGI